VGSTKGPRGRGKRVTDMRLANLDLYALGAVIILILGLGVVSTMDYVAEERRAQLHCDMVEMFEKSNGQVGWPDYNNTAEMCDG